MYKKHNEAGGPEARTGAFGRRDAVKAQRIRHGGAANVRRFTILAAWHLHLPTAARAPEGIVAAGHTPGSKPAAVEGEGVEADDKQTSPRGSHNGAGLEEEPGGFKR